MSRAEACKCGADTIEDHDGAVRNGYPGHVYNGPIWNQLDENPEEAQ